MKMVSSPEMVPTTSGHSALSMATATLCAAPMVVWMTVMRGPGGLHASHELRERSEVAVRTRAFPRAAARSRRPP